MKNLTISAAFLVLAVASAGLAIAQTDTCVVPPSEVKLPADGNADTGQGLLFTSFFKNNGANRSVADTNMAGVEQWAYCSKNNLFMTRWLPGGDILLITNSNYADFKFAEMNLNGDFLNTYNESKANKQLAKAGQQSIIDFNHEVMRLPNGYTAAIAHNEMLSTSAQGGTPQNPVDIMGDEILVVDENWDLVWSWNAFDFLPIGRAAILGETCGACPSGGSKDNDQPDNVDPNCCPIALAPTANDWLHCNSIAYDSTDGNLIVSVRSQDWIIKIDYENGAGDGHVIWSLGNEGNFNMINTPNIPSPWFSHTHDVEIQSTVVPKLIMMFDNGNTRHASDKSADSRGQVLSIDETTFTADIYMNVDFNYYSQAFGTAQLLDNGNYWFMAGCAVSPKTTYPFRAAEYVYNPSTYTGTKAYEVWYEDTAYRSFRLTSLTGSGF
ncbi:MAG: aryl-sulfate sulfotransferase [Bryobacteraceae bacterium]